MQRDPLAIPIAFVDDVRRSWLLASILVVTPTLAGATPPIAEYADAADCAVADGTPDSGAAEGTPGAAVVCSGEDWWLPDTVERSTYGVVHTGWAYPGITKETKYHTKTVGQALNSTWEGLEPTEGDWSSLHLTLYNHSEAECIYHCEEACEGDATCEAACFVRDAAAPWGTYGISGGDKLCTDPDFERKKLYFPLVQGPSGSNTPDFVASTYGIPTATWTFEAWCASDVECAPGIGGGSGYDFYDATVGTDFADDFGAVFDAIIEDWEDTFPTTHPVWDDATHGYLAVRGAFFNRLAAELAVYDPYGLVTQAHINGEGGWMPSYVSSGFLNIGQADQMADDLVDSAIASDLDPSIWMLNIAQGGRAFHQFAERARDEYLTLATHGSTSHLSMQFLQHLDHLLYDDVTKSYQRATSHVTDLYNGFHSDLEVLDKTTNTWGQYRIFRLTTLAVIARGATSVLVTSTTIPSEGNWQNDIGYSGDLNCPKGSTDRACQFQWSEIEDHGAAEFLQWMNHTIGRPPSDAPEAYCTLTDLGVPKPKPGDAAFEPWMSGLSTVEQIDALKASDPTGWTQDANQGTAWSHDHLRTPHVTHFGHYCTLVPLPGPRGQGQAILPMDPTRLGTTDPETDNWVFGAPSADGNYASEARTTFLRPGVNNTSLAFQVADDWYDADDLTAGTDVIVKVTYTVAQDPPPARPLGRWRLEYRSELGTWVAGDTITVDTSDDGLRTATFQLTDAAFDQGGPSGADLAIRHVAGAHAAFLMVRIIKANAGP